MKYEAFLGKLMTDKDVQSWVSAISEKPKVDNTSTKNTSFVYKKTGLELGVNKATNKLVRILFFGPSSSRPYSPYGGALPLGLDFGMSAAEVSQALDRAFGERMFDDPKERGWESPAGFRVSVDFPSDDEALTTLRLYL